jgi:hypothetical protein
MEPKTGDSGQPVNIRNLSFVGTGKNESIQADMIVSCIGYQNSSDLNLPLFYSGGPYRNDSGRTDLPGVYVIGWAANGATGDLSRTMPQCFQVAQHVASDKESGNLPIPSHEPSDFLANQNLR